MLVCFFCRLVWLGFLVVLGFGNWGRCCGLVVGVFVRSCVGRWLVLCLGVGWGGW